MFNWQRFFRLANAHWTEYRKPYAWFIGIGIMIHFAVMLIILIDERGFRAMTTDSQEAIYYVGLFLTAPIFAARYFQLMSKRESALIILMRPASVFEKWLLAFLVVALCYPVIYTLAFYLCNFPAWLIANEQAQLLLPLGKPANTTGYFEIFEPEKYRLFFVFTNIENWGGLIAIGLSLTIIQAFAVLGSLYFRAMPFIKTILFAFLILLATIFLSVLFSSNPDLIVQYWTSDKPMSQQRMLYPFMWACLPTLMWLACYFALKEREVA